MVYLRSMCIDCSKPLCWTGIYGLGGTGKSRLVYELCKEMELRSWRVYYPSRARSTISQIKAELPYAKGNILVCFDDAMSDESSIFEFYQYCEFICNCKIRIIIIDRSFKKSNFEYMQGMYVYDKQIDCIDEKGFLQLSDTNGFNLDSIINSFAENVYNKTLSKDELGVLNGVINQNNENKRVLFALFFVDALCSGYDVRTWDRIDALDMLKRREFERFSNYMEQAYLSKPERSDALFGLEYLIVMCYFNNVIFDDVSDYVLKFYRTDIKSRSFCWVLEQLGVQTEGVIKFPYPDLFLEYISLKHIQNYSYERAVTFTESILLDDYRVMSRIDSINKDYYDLNLSPSKFSLLQCLYDYYHNWIIKRTAYFVTPEDREMINRPDNFLMIEDVLYNYRTHNNMRKIYESVVKKPFTETKWEESKNAPFSLYFKYKKVLIVFLSQEEEYLLLNGAYKSTKKFFDCNKNEAFARKTIMCDFHGLKAKYTGDVILGSIRCGKGVMKTLDDKLLFDGTWMHQRWFGSIYSAFPGEYCEGYGYCHWFRHGRICETDDSYEGEWSGGHPNGNGKWIFHNIDGWFEGKVKDGKPVTGKIKATVHDIKGAFYEGDWKDGKREGEGILTYSDGSRYEGMFENNMRNGQGTYYSVYGSSYSGNWESDDLLFGTIINKSGNTYTGQLKDLRNDGIGTITMADGSKYSGSWKEGFRDGHGTEYAPDGSIIYSGEWKEGSKAEE